MLTICVGNEFQTDGAEYRKECLANFVLIVVRQAVERPLSTGNKQTGVS